MHFAYADPPYLGCGRLYDAHHVDARSWDKPKTHRRLVERLCDQYPDGWAMSLSSPSLRTILPMCPDDCRVGAWIKPFASFKPNVNPAYAWEPVIWRGGRKRGRDMDTARDWVSESITLRRGLTGAKPRRFALWLFDLLGMQDGDVLDDLFPGTNAIDDAWREFTAQRRMNFCSGANRSETADHGANRVGQRDEGVLGTSLHRGQHDGAENDQKAGEV